MKKAATERVRRMEAILDAANEKMDALECAMNELIAYQNEIQQLEAYYTGEDWKNDFALDEAGKLPADLKRGVLSEDGVFNMLEHYRKLLAACEETG
ncbi:MAG: DUF4298 domain-containing protein [Oscillospiraceae bacterium]|nr:DUF4298 domain-containing protein [Oscillospiraceae bacterium]